MSDPEPRPAARARLAYLDQCFRWRGNANRAALTAKFGISPAQAAVDFREYLARCREPRPVYDAARKTYVADEHHVGLEGVDDPPPMLEVIADGAGGRFEALPMPKRNCPPEVVRQLYQAMDRGLRISIDYVSMSSGRTAPQWIAPARIGYDGERIHFRAWSYRHAEWRDYLPVRVSEDSAFDVEPLPDPLPRDDEWEDRVRIELRPKSGLSEEQRSAVLAEYGIADAGLVVETNEALAFYLDRRWGLDQPNARLERPDGEPAPNSDHRPARI